MDLDKKIYSAFGLVLIVYMLYMYKNMNEFKTTLRNENIEMLESFESKLNNVNRDEEEEEEDKKED